jgi:hypothetical protein
MVFTHPVKKSWLSYLFPTIEYNASHCFFIFLLLHHLLVSSMGFVSGPAAALNCLLQMV